MQNLFRTNTATKQSATTCSTSCGRAGRRPEPHDYSIKHVFPKLGETGTAQDIIDLLGTRSA
jgi:hypothetical protein